jgi:hypothetical protein
MHQFKSLETRQPQPLTIGKITYSIIITTIDEFKFAIFAPLKTKFRPLFSIIKGSFAELLHELCLRRILPLRCNSIA